MEKSKQRRYVLFFLVKHDDNKGNNSRGIIKRTKTWILCTLLLILIGLHLVPNGQIKSAPTFVTDLVSHERKSDVSHRKQEVRHIAFLKVHKAGGSTLQNIFFRFGSKRNLTFILPIKGYKFSVNSKFHEPIFDPPPGKEYNILAVHSMFNRTTFTRYLPKSTVYIGIVREPLDLMISGAFYHRDRWDVKYLQNVPKQEFIKNLIHYPEKYDPQSFSLTRNSMAMDFGFPDGLTIHNQTRIKSYLNDLRLQFDLVLIMEYFSESLVLMRRLLRWDFQSILYIPVNGNRHPTMDQLNITADDKQKFKIRNFLDVALYEYFYDIFAAKISEQGPDFKEEVSHFTKIQENIQLFCMISTRKSMPLVVNSSVWHGRFLVFQSDCDTMRKSELEYIDELRERHFQEMMDKL